jgi:hypothetical protein
VNLPTLSAIASLSGNDVNVENILMPAPVLFACVDDVELEYNSFVIFDNFDENCSFS